MEGRGEWDESVSIGRKRRTEISMREEMRDSDVRRVGGYRRELEGGGRERITHFHGGFTNHIHSGSGVVG